MIRIQTSDVWTNFDLRFTAALPFRPLGLFPGRLRRLPSRRTSDAQALRPHSGHVRSIREMNTAMLEFPYEKTAMWKVVWNVAPAV